MAKMNKPQILVNQPLVGTWLREKKAFKNISWLDNLLEVDFLGEMFQIISRSCSPPNHFCFDYPFKDILENLLCLHAYKKIAYLESFSKRLLDYIYPYKLCMLTSTHTRALLTCIFTYFLLWS